ncbi:MAG: ABC transporter substrate-binding protein [Gammaproteobacteria bacterium]|nr:ABC transporter substrate-binding protein [Gammaproteobacteria bacterium]MBU1557140.1 ABC transporter substrate-binding protein [Gammaproteobacteria bacterium]MBU2069183.1 ABC transporter substrate-binding protein [Gammaproteobacteria bacterium]MBU2184160.1 ABC transporter substrate-binding protein [Gammaproteobacteria bacterium]MBU2204950.1 ABC transporter substrate-binding protein [Gammaproteobacteria bacterium]
MTQPKRNTHRLLLALGLSLSCSLSVSLPAWAAPEKPDLKLGFIKLTDMAPLAVALERGYFEDEGLYVQLEAQANWKVLLDRVIDGQLDGAHMLAGQALAATIGIGTRAAMQTAFVMDLNGNACTVSKAVWQQIAPQVARNSEGNPYYPVTADALKPVLANSAKQGKKLQFGMVFPVSSHNYELRYWLAAGGVHPGFYAPQSGDNSGQLKADVLLSVTPPPQMPATMEAGTIDGYCVGEPWNQQAVLRDLGVPLVTNYDIHTNLAEKIFGVSQAWAERYPQTHFHLVKALIRAGHWLDADNNANRAAAAKLISQPFYVGADEKVIANSMTGVFAYARDDIRETPDFNVFFRYHATYPYYSDAVWYLSQMRRWGQISEAKADSWYQDIAKQVFQPALYQRAAKALIAEGKLTAADFPDFTTETGYRPPAATRFIDGKQFDATKPNAYLQQFAIGLTD